MLSSRPISQLKLSFLSIALGLAWVPLSHAHIEHPDSIELDEIKVETSALSLQLSRDVNIEDLSRTLAKDLDDVFRLEPSVQVGTGSRNAQKIFLRGVEDLLLNVQVDGARRGANVFHHQGRIQIDPFLLKQARVLTGPAAADAGPGALGGSVVFETVDAQDLLKADQTFGARVGTQYESASDLKGGLVSLYAQPTDHLGVLLYARENKNSEMRAGGGDKLKSTDGEYTNYLLKASLLDQNGHNLRISTQQSANYGGALRGNWPWQTNQGTLRAQDQQRLAESSHNIGYQYRPEGQEQIDFRWDLYQSETGLKRFLPTGSEEWLTQSYGTNLRNTQSVDLGAVQHSFTYGVDYFKDKGVSRDADYSLSETGQNFGLYLQDRLRLGAWSFSAGLRYDMYRTDYADMYKASGRELSPNLSAEWDLLQGDTQLTLFAGYGESIRGGRLNQAGWLTKYSDDFVLGENGKLKPEAAKLSEAGLRWHDLNLFRQGDHAGLELTFYHTRIDDYLITTGEGPGAKTDRIFNAEGQVISQGFELRGHWGIENWLLNLGYSHNRLRGYDGLPADTTGDSARVGASVGNRWILDLLWQAQPELSLGYTLTAVERLKDVRPGRPQKPGYVVHDLQMQWQPSLAQDQLRFILALENIFDKRYAEHTSVRAFGANSQEFVSWEAGRNLRLGMDWFF
ncbi:TonB-dependent receptor domain-containing protein [Nitrincola tapanii]|uniref:TonB-dependent receptor n=1 Tax=Nitrincola tapanii TaxID=1708751 RepID=A0A5A9W3F7_9GAMM|nr:TonB-dependent receptor [Nitrincola tapanii]KAA0874648.1 TonB-dependent receptor [Nitrincola tapanii]